MGNKIFSDHTFLVDFNRPGSRTQTIYSTTLSGDCWIASRHRRKWRPPTDVYETGDAIEICVEIPGVSEKDLVISCSGTKLRIAGVRKDPTLKKTVHQMEISYGDFSTEVSLDGSVDAARITATYREGFLKIHLPKI